MYIRGKLYRGIVVALFIGLCTGVFGCGKEAASSVPLEQGEHIMYGSYQGEAIECRADARNGFLFPWTDLCRMRGKPV
ncbi:hypothetical protein [Eubacterium ramulus]|nr:hypothetical protein [Eubacterium ramulus]